MKTEKNHTAQHVEDLVAQSDTGARTPSGLAGKILLSIALCWSLFQLWYASPLPFIFNVGIFNDTQARAIHLSFAMFLAFTAYPAFKHSARDQIPLLDWLFAFAGSFSACYLFIFYQQLAERSGAPTTPDIYIACTGMILLLEATRRALGPPLMVVAAIFLTYTFAGPHMPDVIAHKGASLNKAMSHLWLTTEGVYGVALGVSTSFVFLFVLFGAMLEKAGAGAYFIKLAFSLLGHMKGGPAKAAVVASGLSGLVSGSSIANVVTTGTFTIPLMKRVISYVEVIKAAILPAAISYIALLYIVHLEACKANMSGLPRKHQPSMAQKLLSFIFTILLFLVISAAVYYGIGWTKTVFGVLATPMITARQTRRPLSRSFIRRSQPRADLCPRSFTNTKIRALLFIAYCRFSLVSHG